MTYPIIPEWLRPMEKDKFTYPLRSKEEIAFDQEVCPPNFPITLVYKEYKDPVTTGELVKIDPRNEKVKFIIDITTMGLSHQQKERLIFLLGNRYTGSSKVKINCFQFDNFEDNYYRALDIVKQLYWEAKRAPGINLKYLKPNRRSRFIKKYLGKTKEEKEETIQKYGKIFEDFKSNWMKIRAEGDTREKYNQRVMDRYAEIISNEVNRLAPLYPEFVDNEKVRELEQNELLRKQKIKKSAITKKLILTSEKMEEVTYSGLSEKAKKVFNEYKEDTENKN